jgi:hypothetical protein
LAADLEAEVEQEDANEESEKEEEEEDEWVDDEDEKWEDDGGEEETKPHQHVCAHQSCARHDGKDALELFAQLKDAIMGNASAPSGSTCANVMLGVMCVGQQLTAADVQLIVENQIEMARLGELARKYYLTQQLLNLLSKK